MKRIIDGKLYNTDTAIEIASWDNGLYSSDFGHCTETLYKTKNGAFFVYGSGGAMSRWSVPVGSNGRGGGDGMEALTEAEALRWCEDCAIDVDDMAEHFTTIQDA